MNDDLRGRLDAVEDAVGDTDRTFVIRETVVGTGWAGGDLDPDETDTETTEVHL